MLLVYENHRAISVEDNRNTASRMVLRVRGNGLFLLLFVFDFALLLSLLLFVFVDNVHVFVALRR